MRTVHCTLYNAHFKLHTVHIKLYTAHSTLQTIHSTMYTAICTLQSINWKLYTKYVHYKLQTLNKQCMDHCTLLQNALWRVRHYQLLYKALGANVSYQMNWVIQKKNDCFWVCLFWHRFEILKSTTKTKTNNMFLFCLSFQDFKFVLGIFTTLLTTKLNKCIFLSYIFSFQPMSE